MSHEPNAYPDVPTRPPVPGESYDVAVCPSEPTPNTIHGGRCSRCGRVIFWTANTQRLAGDAPKVCPPCGRALAAEDDDPEYIQLPTDP